MHATTRVPAHSCWTGHLGAALAASLALHGLLLAAIGPGAGTAGVSTHSVATLQVRLAAGAPPAQPVAAPATAAPARPVTPATVPLHGPAPTKYFRSSELDERATPLEIMPLDYPDKAYAERLPGAVQVRVYISEDGRVDRAEVLAASPVGYFEQAAIDAVSRTRFRPARKDGRAVASQKLVEVSFDPYGPAPGQGPRQHPQR